MKKILIRLTSLVLVLLMLSVAVACAETGSVEETTAPAQTEASIDTSVDTVPETTAINAENILGLRDYTGETLTFFSRIYNGPWGSDISAEDINGTVLNDAIYKRNSTISEKYGITIAEQESGNITFRDQVGNRISSGDTSYQVLYMGDRICFVLVI